MAAWGSAALVFESKERLASEITQVLEALRAHADGRYACLLDANTILFESPQPADRESWALRGLIEQRRTALFAVPAALAAEQPLDDVFEGFESDDVLLAFINGKVALVLACPDAESVRESARKHLEVLSDRLFRLDTRYRIDERGHGAFFGRARLDVVVVGRPDRER